MELSHRQMRYNEIASEFACILSASWFAVRVTRLCGFLFGRKANTDDGIDKICKWQNGNNFW